jgi:hypothetical protein
MASTDSSPDLMKQADLPPSSPNLRPGGAPDDPDAVIAALDEAEVAYDEDADLIGRRPDSSADVIEILDAEPILAEDEGLAGAPDPVDLITRRARNETPRDRAAVYERELQGETRKANIAVLQHELAVHAERSIADESDVTRAYATAMSTDPSLRPNLWALRRIFYRRSLWPSLLKLLDTEARFAPTKRERAEVWTEKGHILEALLDEVDEAIICYRTAHELDPTALAPLAALEKLLGQKSGAAGSSSRPSEELLGVYRDLSNATREPGRRVALLIEQARIEEERNRAVEPAGGAPADLDRVLTYLHDAYDVGIDQARVIDEIVRITAASGRIPDCLAALEVRAEIYEMQAQQATAQRRPVLIDQVVAIRRWQANLARERLGNPDLAWQYLDKAQQKAPGDPLLLPDLIAMAEAQGRHAELAALLQQREDQLRISRGNDMPAPIGLWLKRALALRNAGQDAEADELEQRIAATAPTHLLLLLGRQRRALRAQDLGALAQLLREEAQLAAQGLATASGDKQPDQLWAIEALLLSADLALRAGDLKRAQETLVAATQLQGTAAPDSAQAGVLRELLQGISEQLLHRGRRYPELAALYEQQLASATAAGGAATPAAAEQQQRLREALVDLYSGLTGEPAKALAALEQLYAAAPEDLRLLRRAVLLARRSGDAAQEATALRAIERVEQKLGLGSPRPWDLLRRAELLTQGGQQGAAEAAALYEEILKQRPGEPQALEPLERLLLADGKHAELAALWRKQIEVAATAVPRGDNGKSDAAQRLLQLQVKLAELLQNDPEQLTQAVALYRAILTQRPGYWPALRGLARLYRRQNDVPRVLTTLEQLAAALPAGAGRADVLLRLGELRDEVVAHRPAEADEAYQQALQTLPVPSPAAAHAALGRLRALMQKRGYAQLPEVLDGLSDSLLPDEPLARVVTALLSEERAFVATQTASGSTVLERAESELAKARSSLATAEPGSAYPEAVTLLELGRLRVAQKREDGKQQGAMLAALAQHLLSLGDQEPKPAIGELWLRAGLLGSLNEDEPAAQAEAARRLLAAYRLLGDVPQVVVPLCDLLADPSLAEQLARAPEVLTALRARKELCPVDELEDRLQWTLLEAEVWLLRATDSQGVEVDVATRASCCASAASAAMAALELDPHSVMALLLLRQASVPTAAEMDRSGAPLDAAAAARVHAYALYTLRLAGELRDDEARADLYAEAAQLLLRLCDTDGAAAALRTVLDSRPLDAAAFSELHPLLTRRAEEAGDPGPLLELLNFRLAQPPRPDGDEARAEQALRVTLLGQRAAILRKSGQDLNAEEDLKALLALAPDHSESHRRLAELRAEYGDAEAAIYHYERFLLDAKPADRQDVHAAAARLLAPLDAARAASHVQKAIEFGQRYRAMRGDEVDTPDEVRAQIDLYRWLSELQLKQDQRAEAVATLRELRDKLPADGTLAAERQQVMLELADALEQHQGDRPGALQVIDQVLKEAPLSLPALERMIALCKQTGEVARSQAALARAAAEARKRLGALSADPKDGKLDPGPLHALGQIFKWQGQSDLHNFALQAEAVFLQASGQPAPAPVATPAQRVPGRSVGPPLRTLAFPAEARGVLSELWSEVSESAHRVLGPELGALGVQAKERLNVKEVPASWANVDQLANRFGLGSSGMTLAYGLYPGREKDQCLLSGSNLVCGSSYIGALSQLPPGLYFRLLRRLALLPDRMGPLDGDPQELLVFIAACCNVAQLPAPALGAELKTRLDERTRALDRAISRKERNAIKALAPRLAPLAGSDGKDVILAWQQAVQLGAAQLALAIAGNLAAALADLGISLRDGNIAAARTARALCAFAVSAEVHSLRRELGLTE